MNRKGFPDSLRDTKMFSKTARHGDHKSVLIHNGKTECLVWMDKIPVHIINSISNPNSMTNVKRTAKDGSRLIIPCPESIKLYNAYMGGVDLFDFRRKTYSCSRKSKKWWLRLFYFLVDMATTNAYIIYKEQRNVKLTQKDFILQVADRLISSHSSHKRAAVLSIPSCTKLLERHFPDRQESTKNCKCVKDTNEQYIVATNAVQAIPFLSVLCHAFDCSTHLKRFHRSARRRPHTEIPAN